MTARRWFVTGGAGFIGSAVARAAIAAGDEVRVIDALTYAASPGNLRDVETDPRFGLVEADIRDRRRMAEELREFRPDAVLHLAAESHVDRSIDGPLAFVSTNIDGTAALLEGVRETRDNLPGDFRLVHVSTDEVYGSLGPEGRFTEETPYSPNSPYAASKAGSDMLTRAWGRTYGLPVIVTNCSNNYGPYQHPEKLIPTVILACRAGRSIPVYGQGANVRDWLHVEDHAEALLTMARRGVPGETYNIGGDAERRNIDVVRTICRLMDDAHPEEAPHDRLITFVKDRPGHDLRYAIDASKAARELGIVPRHDFEAGLAETVRWYLNNDAWIEGVRARGFDGERLGLGKDAAK